MLDTTPSIFAAIDFEAEVSPLFDREGRKIPAHLGRAVHRKDTGDLLSICGPIFKPIQHMDLIDTTLQTMKDEGYEIYERSADKRTLYDLAGHKGAFVNVTAADNGAVMQTSIITGDFIRPTGSTAYLDQGPDTMLHEITVLNSHNAKLAASVEDQYQRLICMNGIRRPEFTIRSYAKHTHGFSMEAFKANVLHGASLMAQDAALFGLYAATKLSPVQAEELLKGTLAKMANKPNGDAHWSEPLLQKILRLFQTEDQTVWGLVQAMTYWATHDDMKASANVVTGRIGRHDRVANVMASKQFKALLQA